MKQKTGFSAIAAVVIGLLLGTSMAQAGVKVFVTSLSYDGNFPGLAGADAACTTAANNAGLPGTWTAWLSDNDTDAVDRIFDAGTSYQLVDGTVIADSLADLLDGTLDSPIQVDETGTPILGGAVDVWTATGTDGTNPGVGTCSNWTTNVDTQVAQIGRLNAMDATWTDAGGGKAANSSTGSTALPTKWFLLAPLTSLELWKTRLALVSAPWC